MTWWEAFEFGSPWALTLLPLVIVLAWWVYGWRRRSAVRFSSTRPMAVLERSWRARLGWLPPTLRLIALLLLVLSLARPRKGNEQTRIPSEGIAIQLIVDRSGSMRAMDFEINRERVDRLAAVRDVVHDFVEGDAGLRGRPDDLIGLIAFAQYADEKCPLTLDHGYLVDVLDKTPIVTEREEDGTAIGDALGLGVERLRALEDQRRVRGGDRIKSKLIILLTDGENNAGDLAPVQAAELAAAYDIKVYTIGAGTRGLAPMPVRDPFTGRERLRSVPVSIDEETLKRIADATGGEYYRATDTDSLREIYANIDRLEKTRTEELRFYDYREMATQAVTIGRLPVPPLLLSAFVLLALELVLRHTWLRRLP